MKLVLKAKKTTSQTVSYRTVIQAVVSTSNRWRVSSVKIIPL